jgi:RNA polymerase sigma factor (TIGR02999 family)
MPLPTVVPLATPGRTPPGPSLTQSRSGGAGDRYDSWGLTMDAITQVLNAIEQGDPRAAEQLLPLVYDELRKLAAHRLAGEGPGHTLQPTALVHEAYLKLVGPDPHQPWNGRVHFFAAAAEAMRRILIDHARRKHRARRGGKMKRVELDDIEMVAESGGADELLALDEALTQLAAADARKAELVRLRYFAGLTLEQAAELLGISRATADRHWAFARAWLYDAMSRGHENP